MPRVSLSTAFVKSVACPDGQKKIEYFDCAQRGFLLEVRCSGGKTYYQRYSDIRGRERQFKIGPANMLSLAAARRKGRAVVAEVLTGITDPQDRRAELRTVPTLAEFVRDRYLPHIKSYKRSWTTDETVLRVHVQPVLGATFIDVLRADQIMTIVQNMQKKGYATGTTNRVVIVLRHLFNLARKWRVPGITENPTAGIALAPDVTRERFLSFEDMQRLIVSIEKDENRVAARAIMLLLLTGARRNEITQARWDYVDWEKRKLLVPLSKSGKPRTIALNNAALELLRRMRSEIPGPYIVPSGVTGAPPPSLFFPWNRIRERAGLPDLRLHDLRHSFASFLVNRGISLYVVQELLGHGHARYTQRYAHLLPDTLHEAAESVGEVVASATQGATQPFAHCDSPALTVGAQ
jgi:integrase